MEQNPSNTDTPSQFDNISLWQLLYIVLGETGLEKSTSADLFGQNSNPDESLYAEEWKVLKIQDAKGEEPASVTFNITYSQPYWWHNPRTSPPMDISSQRYSEPEEQPIKSEKLLYHQILKVYFAADAERLHLIPDNETSNMAESQDNAPSLLRLKPDIEGKTIIHINNEEPFPHQQKYLKVYAQATPSVTKSAKLARIQTGFPLLIASDFANIRFHAGIAEIYHKEEGILPSDKLVASNNYDISNNSGRSGASTYRLHFVNTRKNSKDFDCILTVVEGEPQRKVAEYAVACQKALREKGIPVAKIHRPVTPYYYEATGQCYYIQEFARGVHFDFDERHLAKLGKALADIHTIPVNEMPRPSIHHTLPSQGLVSDIQEALTALENRGESSPIFAQDEEMRFSMKNQLITRFSRQELLTPQLRNLCNALGITHSDIAEFERASSNRQKLNRALPKGTCWGDMHLPNLLGDENGNITLLDFQQCGEGVLADELALTTYFLLAGEDGHFSASRTRAFFTPYCEGREKQGRPGPLTQEEIIAILEKVHDLCGRQTHPIWMMMRNQPIEKYKTFSLRHQGLREQVEGYMENGKVTQEGANRFAEAFLGRSLSSFPSIPKESHVTSSLRNPPRSLCRSGA